MNQVVIEVILSFSGVSVEELFLACYIVLVSICYGFFFVCFQFIDIKIVVLGL